MTASNKLIEDNLRAIVSELYSQDDIGQQFPPELQSFSEQIAQICEWIDDAGEYGVAYEVLVSMLERFQFKLTGGAAVKLLEVGLVLRFKTEQPKDAQFDSR